MSDKGLGRTQQWILELLRRWEGTALDGSVPRRVLQDIAAISDNDVDPTQAARMSEAELAAQAEALKKGDHQTWNTRSESCANAVRRLTDRGLVEVFGPRGDKRVRLVAAELSDSALQRHQDEIERHWREMAGLTLAEFDRSQKERDLVNELYRLLLRKSVPAPDRVPMESLDDYQRLFYGRAAKRGLDPQVLRRELREQALRILKEADDRNDQ